MPEAYAASAPLSGCADTLRIFHDTLTQNHSQRVCFVFPLFVLLSHNGVNVIPLRWQIPFTLTC